MRKLSVFTLALMACGSSSANPDASVADAGIATDGRAPDAGTLVLHKVYTQYLGKLIGTSRTPLAPVGLFGTDLGASFVRDGKLLFLFGDSVTTAAYSAESNDDSIAYTTPSPLPPDGTPPPLQWFLDPGGSGRFLSVTIPTIDLKAFNVPVEGIPMGSVTYLFASTGWSDTTMTHTTSVLAHTEGLSFDQLVLDHAVPSSKFINISAVSDAHYLYLFGSGPYRQSAVYLARVDPNTIADRTSWQYYQGSFAGATWATGEASAQPVVPATCVGELSVRQHPTLPLFLMTYNCATPRGILLRTAPSPMGPWSDPPIVILDPWVDHAYEHFMHAQTSTVGFDDGLSDIGREEEWGGEYGPYLIPPWFTDDAPGIHSIVYTVSSWNPYTVHLVRTVLGEPGRTASPPALGVGLPPASLQNAQFADGMLDGWQASGDPFVTFLGGDGRYRVTTYVSPKNDAVVGQLWQDFTVDAGTSTINFTVHGGHAAVQLYRGTDLVRSTRGRDTNSPETPVTWQISEFRGQTLRLMINDDQPTGPWGFIGTTGFTFQ